MIEFFDFISKSIHSLSHLQVRNCRLVGLPDLRVGSSYVRQKIAGYLNDLIGLGVAGIRIDAAKHMWPGDIATVLGMTRNLNTDHGFRPGAKLFVYQVSLAH